MRNGRTAAPRSAGEATSQRQYRRWARPGGYSRVEQNDAGRSFPFSAGSVTTPTMIWKRRTGSPLLSPLSIRHPARNGVDDPCSAHGLVRGPAPRLWMEDVLIADAGADPSRCARSFSGLPSLLSTSRVLDAGTRVRQTDRARKIAIHGLPLDIRRSRGAPAASVSVLSLCADSAVARSRER